MKPEEIKDLISNAFAPYKCEAALFDLNHRIKFRILKESKVVLTVDDLFITGMNRQDVNGIIESCKSKINSTV